MGSYITAKIIKKNNTTYINYDANYPIIGVIGTVPTPQAGGEIEGDFWAVPVDDSGVLSGIDFIPCSPTDEVPPTPNSFHCVLIVSRNFRGRENTWIFGRSTFIGTGSPIEYGYVQASSDVECCAANPRQMPLPTAQISPQITMCLWDENGAYFANWGLPKLNGNQRYYPYGFYNNDRNIRLTGQTATGYATTAALVTYLNTQWGAYGTFTFANNQLKFVQTGGTGETNIALTVSVVNPSA